MFIKLQIQFYKFQNLPASGGGHIPHQTPPVNRAISCMSLLGGQEKFLLFFLKFSSFFGPLDPTFCELQFNPFHIVEDSSIKQCQLTQTLYTMCAIQYENHIFIIIFVIQRFYLEVLIFLTKFIRFVES